MGLRDRLYFKNCFRRPGRSVALIGMSVLLCFSLLAGLLINMGMHGGLDSLETRLGADIMVVPYEAVTKNEFDDMILQGSTGYFYMDRTLADKVASREGVGQVSYQLYLASLSASCCSTKVQMIGFDQDTDFVITPWLGTGAAEKLGQMEVYVGFNINAFAGDTLTFYGVDVKVAGRLDETGTYIDSAVYADEETIQSLIAQAEENKTFKFSDTSTPDQLVSCVLINVADGYSVEEVMNDINIHVRGVEAVRTSNMVSDVSDKLKGITGMAGFMVVTIWILVLAIMVMAFAMISNERKKEFAVLRMAGASRRGVFSLIFKENLLVSIIGSAAGALLALAVGLLFGDYLKRLLSVPFLLPGAASLLLLGLLAVAVSVAGASLSAGLSAIKASRVDAALTLRGEN